MVPLFIFIQLVTSQIITLHENNIEKYLDMYDNLLVTITSPLNATDMSPWLSVMDYSSKILLQQDQPIIVGLASVNSTKLSNILRKYNIFERNLPTVKFFIQKNYIECDLFNDFIQNKELPTVMKVASWVMLRVPIYVLRLANHIEVDSFLIQNEVSTVFIGQNISEYYKTFQNLREYDNQIQAASCPSCLNQTQDTIILDLNGHRSNLSAPFTKKELYNFLDENAWPKVMEYSMRAHERVIHLGLPAIVLFISNQLENFKQTMDTFVGIGNRTENIFFMYIIKERVGRDWQRLVQYVGVTQIPGIQILDLQDKFSHFEMKEELTEENITRFIKQYQIQGVRNVGESLMQNPEVKFNPYAKKSDRFH